MFRVDQSSGCRLLGVLFTLVSAGCGEASSGPSAGPAAVAIVSLSADTLQSGTIVDIVGSGFAPVASANAVTVDGVPATVDSARTTSLTITVPLNLPCQPVRSVSVSVRTSSGQASRSVPLRAGVLRSLAVGQSAVVEDPSQLACIELPGGGERYVLTVFNDNPTAAPSQPFVIAGSSGTAGSTARAPLPPSATSAPMPDHDARTLASPLSGVAAMIDHASRLEQSLRFLDRAHAGRRMNWARIRSPRASAMLVAPPPVGSVRALNVPTQGCTGTRIGARVVYVSNRAILYEDTSWVFRGQMDTMYKKLGDIFDSQLYPTDSAAFADPLLTDSLTDHDGRIGMVFSPLVPPGALGFASPCDLVPPSSSNTTSNLGEYFYGQLPTGSGGSLNSGYTPLVWLLSMQGTAVHETKHLASFEWRLLHQAPPEEGWLEEALARHAEEQWGRKFVYHVGWKANTGYAASVYCDQHNLTDPRCAGQPEAMWDAFTLMYNFLDSTAFLSPFGATTTFDVSYYDSGWSLVRWALDRYAGDEQAMLRSLTQSQSLTGIRNLAAATSASVDDILGNWSLALLVDDSPVFAGNSDVAFPTWQLYDILLGLRADFPTFYTGPAPPVVQRVTGDVSIASNGVRGGGFVPVVLTTSSPAAFTLSVRGVASNAAAPATLRIAIARLSGP